ncbi:hypothetical protein KEJ15_01595 [Candidatus Bathyarchaeota archaeon]|nr:hypothetical protein [Candidatus Bathyarchaeota archaeon]
MPSILPGHLYTFAALLAVSSLLVFSFMVYAGTARTSSEIRLLNKLLDHVAADASELLNIALTVNATIERQLQMPSAIGNQQYWLRLRNDSSSAWLEGGLGATPIEGSELKAYLPNGAFVSGSYLSGHGSAKLTCFLDDGILRVQLSSANGD